MWNFGYCNKLKRLTREQFDRELAEKAARADAIIAICGVFGLAVLAVVHLVERLA